MIENPLKALTFFIVVIFINLLFATAAYTQIPDCMIHSRYASFYKWDDVLKDYVPDGEDWMDVYMDITEDYYRIQIEEEDAKKIYWQFVSIEEGIAEYHTQDDRKVLFMSEGKGIVFMYKWEDEYDRYSRLVILSKIEKLK